MDKSHHEVGDVGLLISHKPEIASALGGPVGLDGAVYHLPKLAEVCEEGFLRGGWLEASQKELGG